MTFSSEAAFLVSFGEVQNSVDNPTSCLSLFAFFDDDEGLFDQFLSFPQNCQRISSKRLAEQKSFLNLSQVASTLKYSGNAFHFLATFFSFSWFGLLLVTFDLMFFTSECFVDVWNIVRNNCTNLVRKGNFPKFFEVV